MDADTKFIVAGAGVAALALLYLVKRPGAAAEAGEAIGGAVVDAAEGAIVGTVGGIGDIIGLPSPSETITDASQCLMHLNERGYWSASAHCSAPAFFEASMMKLSETL